MPITHLTDFSDRISPMLVKELRQGLRAKTFIVVFLALQIFLAVMLFSAGASSSSDHVGSVVSSIIFTFFAITVLIVQPLRGISALSSEVKGNTIDMMVLTRLSAWRIVFGKWVAIVSQSALLLSTIIPYLILRYFFGGMNLVAELVFLMLMFLTSMGLTAVTVGLSGCKSLIVRAMLPVLGIPVLLYASLVVTMMRAFGGGGGIDMDALSLDSADSRIGVATYAAVVVYLGASMLSLGASLIAPDAENHSIIRRLVAAGALLAVFALGFFEKLDEELVVLLVMVIAIPAIMIALTESAHLVETVCKPFVRRGKAAAAVGWFFYPTWCSGILYALLLGILGLAAIAVAMTHGSGISHWGDDDSVVVVSIFGGLLFPAAWQVFLFRGEGQRVAHYLLLLAGSFIMLGILAALSDSMNNGDFLWVFAWNPLAFIAMLEEHTASDSTLLACAVSVDIALMLILLTRAVIDIRKFAPVIQETRESLETAA